MNVRVQPTAQFGPPPLSILPNVSLSPQWIHFYSELSVKLFYGVSPVSSPFSLAKIHFCQSKILAASPHLLSLYFLLLCFEINLYNFFFHYFYLYDQFFFYLQGTYLSSISMQVLHILLYNVYLIYILYMYLRINYIYILYM